MLKLSNYPFDTEKSTPKISDNLSTWYLLQSWIIRQEIAWAFNFMPMWVKIIRNIEKIIRKNIESSWAMELQMTSLWSKDVLEKSWRWDSVDVLFKVKWQWNSEYPLNFTHEESATWIAKSFIKSYKQLPFSFYQHQTKFRNEKRAKSWLLRWREFFMHDQYSFHKDKDSLDEFYKYMTQVYHDTYKELGIWKETYYTYASWWNYSDQYSHEYQTILDIWEDTIHICKNCNIAFNKEIVWANFNCLECWSKDFEVKKASEVWNIFKLMTNFSEKLGLYYSDSDSSKKPVYMWSYWIGISRTMWVIAEYFMDEKWLVWPLNISPYRYYIIVNWGEKEEKYALELAEKIEKSWYEVIIDDRKSRFGQKAQDADLLWIPNRIIVSKKSIESWWFEFKKRTSDKTYILSEFISNEILDILD